MATAKRRTKEEMIKELEERLKKLKEETKAAKAPKLTKDSDGMPAAIDAVVNAAEKNKVTIGDVITMISSIKRCGLEIKKKPRKQKEK
jgi:sugar-specific transcriptional regulator TrmB